MPERLDWHSAIGNFMLNFGTLDLFLSDCLELTLTNDEFAKVRCRHFRDRLEVLRRQLAQREFPKTAVGDVENLLRRTEPIRDLRNHIAHGTMRLGLGADKHTWEVTLSLPRDLDGLHSAEARHLSFAELEKALVELVAVIEGFKKLLAFLSDAPGRPKL